MRVLTALFLVMALGIPAALYHWQDARGFEIQIAGSAPQEASSAEMRTELTADQEEAALVAAVPSLISTEPETSTRPEGHLGRINQMSAAEWTQIKGIGLVTAQRILEYKASIRAFTTLEQLLEVKGIGPAKYAAILEWLNQPGSY